MFSVFDLFFFCKKKERKKNNKNKRTGGDLFSFVFTTFDLIMTPNYLQETVRADMVLANPVLNVMEIGQIKKCVVSSSSSSFALDQKKVMSTLSALELICGQKIQVTRARQSIAAFKLREGVLIGCKSTLRKRVMWAFLEKCTTIVLPRMRLLPYTLRGQRNGSLNFSLLNLLLFPELENHFELFEGVTAINVNLTYCGNSREENKKCSSFFSALQVVGNVALFPKLETKEKTT